MPSLRERQRQFVAAVTSAMAGDIESTQRVFGARSDVYRRNVAANFRNALGATYPVVKRLVGAAFFNAAVDGYVIAVPSASGDLNAYGDRFAEFLETYSPAQSLPYLPCVARLEWAIDEANRAADDVGEPERLLAHLTKLPGDQLASVRITLGPSCRLVVSPYPVMRIWQTNQPDYDGDVRVDLDEGGDNVLVRRETDSVALERILPGEHAWLTALAHDAPLAEAIEAAQRVDPTFDLTVALRKHLAAGTFVEIIGDDVRF
jgi:hypothetical protein